MTLAEWDSMGAQLTALARGPSESGRCSSPGPDALRPQELFHRLIGTRAELNVRIDGALEQIMHLQLDGRDAEACKAISSLCDALDATIEAVAVLSTLESG
jgi:hypothetical protein